MTHQQINAAIAKSCGWIDVWRVPNVSKTAYFVGTSPSGEFLPVPNYCSDLNAMHEAEKVLGEKRIRTYAFLLAQILDTSPTVDLDDQFLNIHATARQRAEAFLRTLGKWEEVQG